MEIIPSVVPTALCNPLNARYYRYAVPTALIVVVKVPAERHIGRKTVNNAHQSAVGTTYGTKDMRNR